jgi:hypothetical protein
MRTGLDFVYIKTRRQTMKIVLGTVPARPLKIGCLKSLPKITYTGFSSLSLAYLQAK